MGPWRTWLTDHGSLTARLQARCTGFNVARVRQEKMRPFPDERAILGLAMQSQSVVREVLLNCGNVPLVFAHTIIPLKALDGPWRALATLGNRPLGATLFSDPHIQRFPLEYKALDARHHLYRATGNHVATLPRRLWARRSLFSLQDHPILVTEVFLPPLLKLP